MKILKPCLFISACLIFILSACDLPRKVTREEELYRDFFAWYFQGSVPELLVIEEYTTVILLRDEQTLHSILTPLKKEDYELTQETIDDFIAKNSAPGALPSDMDLGVKYVLLSKNEADAMQKNQLDIGIEIERKYPGSFGDLFTLSRVGFNQEQTSALISFNHWFAHSGAGAECLFEKEWGHWVWKVCFRSWKIN